MAKRKKFKRALSRTGGFLGIKSVKDVGEVAVTSAGSNYFSNIVATAVGMGGNRWIRPVVASLIGYVISRRQLRASTVIGSALIGLSQAGVIGSLGGIGRTISGTNNPPRGQQAMNQPNILGRLP